MSMLNVNLQELKHFLLNMPGQCGWNKLIMNKKKICVVYRRLYGRGEIRY